MALSIDMEENRKLKLYKAAMSGDWRKAEAIFRNHSEAITAITKINHLGETALHIATVANRTHFVQRLVNSMIAEDLEVKSNRSDTAFFYAVVCGYITTAKIMLDKNAALATIRGREDMLPIQAAALHGHELMVRCLYKNAKDRLLDDGCGIHILIALIDCNVYDIAIQMVSEEPSLATQANNKGETALSAFARKPRITSGKSSNSFWNDILTYMRNKPRRPEFGLVKLLLRQILSSRSVVEEENRMLIKKALFIAAEKGNSEFLTILIHMDPSLAFEVDENCYTIFHIAVQHRHAGIFSILHEIDSMVNLMKLIKDNPNNLLHLAGKLPLSGLQVVPGAALQLQRELIWFQEVRKMVGAHQMEAKNDEGKTPRELFEELHEGLREDGEKWMKDVGSSCMVVSTLVAGVAFASSVTLPGGNKGDTGIPNLLHDISFNIFLVANAVSLICSASSILLFLTIFTSHYSMANFLRYLPMKFVLGLVLLSVAVQTMLIAFVAAFFITSHQQLLAVCNFIITIATLPLVLFFLEQFPLIRQVYYSSFSAFSLFRHNKNSPTTKVFGDPN